MGGDFLDIDLSGYDLYDMTDATLKELLANIDLALARKEQSIMDGANQIYVEASEAVDGIRVGLGDVQGGLEELNMSVSSLNDNISTVASGLTRISMIGIVIIVAVGLVAGIHIAKTVWSFLR